MCLRGCEWRCVVQMTIDSHLEIYLAQIECTDEGDALFIKQVVYGCLRFKKLNKVNLTALYFKHGTEVSREDYHLYMVLSYLTLMRLEDMGVPVFRKFIFSQDYQKMFVWLSFIFNSQVHLVASICGLCVCVCVFSACASAVCVCICVCVCVFARV
jgi:hypothetical protein